MATIWLTYAWEDNHNQDVDYVAQELTKPSLSVNLDRWTIGAGKRLWEQIENFIMNPAECDVWALYATPESLGSEPCKEEFAYALHRALAERGATFPIVGIFPSPIDETLIPAGIKTRLYVSMTDPDWRERVIAAAEARTPNINRPEVNPYFLQVHNLPNNRFAIEVRPRAGVWRPFMAGIPFLEKDLVNPWAYDLPAGRLPPGDFNFVQVGPFEGPSADGLFWLFGSDNEATPYRSYFIFCNALPSKLIFGVQGAAPQYHITFPQ